MMSHARKLALAVLPTLLVAFSAVPLTVCPTTRWVSSSTTPDQKQVHSVTSLSSSRVLVELRSTAKRAQSNHLDDKEKIGRIRRILNFITRPFRKTEKPPQQTKDVYAEQRLSFSESDELLGVAEDEQASEAIMRDSLRKAADALAEPKRRKLYEGRKSGGKSGGKGSSSIAGSVMDRPSDAGAARKGSKSSASTPSAAKKRSERKPVGGSVDGDILDSVSPVPMTASAEDVERMNRLFGLSSSDKK
mmetsp:Transcript_21088/g.41793  ORF Transcript_21088/g.41793 Transcript_21088/m.41793 type:complete len:247 (+) Transcript_21088:61-801(+)